MSLLWEPAPPPSISPSNQTRSLHGAGKPIPAPEAAAWHRAPHSCPRGACMASCAPFLSPRQLHGIVCPAPASAAWGAVWVAHTGCGSAQPQGPPLLPWRFLAPFCQLQDGVENPRTRNFLTDMQTLGLPQPFAVRNAVSPPVFLQISGFLSPCTHMPCCIPVGTCPTPQV